MEILSGNKETHKKRERLRQEEFKTCIKSFLFFYYIKMKK